MVFRAYKQKPLSKFYAMDYNERIKQAIDKNYSYDQTSQDRVKLNNWVKPFAIIMTCILIVYGIGLLPQGEFIYKSEAIGGSIVVLMMLVLKLLRE